MKMVVRQLYELRKYLVLSIDMSEYVFGRLGKLVCQMLVTMNSSQIVGASIEMKYVLRRSFRVVVLMKLTRVVNKRLMVQ